MEEIMNLIDFARTAPLDQTPEEFVQMLKNVLPLNEVKSLNREESLKFYSAVQWLYDLSILSIEYNGLDEQGPSPTGEIVAALPGSNGPFIEDILTRGNVEPDFSQLEARGLTNQ